MSKNKSEVGFVSHLAELRQRLINSLIFLTVLFILSYFFSDYIYGFLVEPYSKAVEGDLVERRLIFTALQETFFDLFKGIFFCCLFYYMSIYTDSNLEIYSSRFVRA